MSAKHRPLVLLGMVVCLLGSSSPPYALEIHVDPTRGDDAAQGNATAPLRSIEAALARIPEPLNEEATIRLAEDTYGRHGSSAASNNPLFLSHRMRAGGRVRFVGDGNCILNWTSPDGPLIAVREGNWSFEGIRIGSRLSGQREGLLATGPAVVEVRDCTVRTASSSAAGLRAVHGGRIYLKGRIQLNEDLHEDAGATESFCGIIAEYGGLIAFNRRDKSSLSIGNGSLSASYGGIIELGCETARITSWGQQSNCLAINNTGRIDLHNTTTTLCAMLPQNTPIGLEHDGHVLAEGAKIVIEGRGNGDAIVLQKASTFFCNDVEIRGNVNRALTAYSGSTLLAGVIGDLGPVRATTGATIIIEKCTGRITDAILADAGGRIVLPNGDIADAKPVMKKNESDRRADSDFSPLLLAARTGDLGEVGRLLKEGANPNQKGPGETTALHQAAAGGHLVTALRLIEAGADARLVDEDGRTPSQQADLNGHTETAISLRQMELTVVKHSN